MMTRWVRTASVVAAIAAASLGQVVAAPEAQAAGTVHGCPSGAVCVYPQNKGWNGDRPSSEFWSYGAHNLSNQVGTHRVFNNQYGGAWVWECLGYNGRGGSNAIIGAGSAFDDNLTPINSMLLTTAGGKGC